MHRDGQLVLGARTGKDPIRIIVQHGDSRMTENRLLDLVDRRDFRTLFIDGSAGTTPINQT